MPDLAGPGLPLLVHRVSAAGDQAPLLVLQGGDDQYGIPAQVESIVARTGGPATPLLLEGCGHSPHLELPELTLEHMASLHHTSLAG